MKNQIWTLILVTIVVAVIASLATLSLTGNIIKVKPTITGTQVYTKTEIDSKFSGVNASVLNMLKNCSIVDSMYGIRQDNGYYYSGSSICIENKKNCILTSLNGEAIDNWDTSIIGCEINLGNLTKYRLMNAGETASFFGINLTVVSYNSTSATFSSSGYTNVTRIGKTAIVGRLEVTVYLGKPGLPDLSLSVKGYPYTDLSPRVLCCTP